MNLIVNFQKNILICILLYKIITHQIILILLRLLTIHILFLYMPSPSSWSNGVAQIPNLSKQDVVKITRYVNHEPDTQIKEVESVESSNDYWSNKVHFLDGSMLRKRDTDDAKWQWYTIYQRPYPLRAIKVIENQL